MSRSYEAARREHLGEPIEFQVGYYDADDNHQVETFTCVGELSSLTMSQFAASMDLDAVTPEGAAILWDTFTEMFGDEAELRRFTRFRRKHRLSDEQLIEIMGGLMEDFTGRPTARPSSSPSTPSRSGPDSKAGSSPFNAAARPVAISRPKVVDGDAQAAS